MTGTDASRRSLLRTGGLAAVGTVVGIGALPSAPSSPERSGVVEATDEADLPERVAAWTGEPIESEDETPIARYHYKPTGGGEYVATAPINVVLVTEADEGGDALDRVTSVLGEASWTDPEEYMRYAWDRERKRYVEQQATAAETFYGTSGRHHARCWSFEGIVSMQVHEDSGARPRHTIESYAEARAMIETLFDEAGWAVSPGAIDLANERGPDHDGTATVIAAVDS